MQNNFNKPFIGYVMDDKKYTYHVYLINPTCKTYPRVRQQTGMVMTSDDDIIQSGVDSGELGVLPPFGMIKIESDNWDALDFSIWFNLDIYEEHGKQPWKVFFSLPRYWHIYTDRTVMLPILKQEGQPIELMCKNRKEIE
jgi:hypothetical protein